MSEATDSPTTPRSVRHKRILDVAAADPDASLEAIAAEVPSATPDLVDRVLEQFGDPAETETDPTENPAPSEPGPPSMDALSDKQMVTVRAIHERPDATQRELGEELGVSASTISERVRAIDGLEWSDRQAVVDKMFDSSQSPPPDTMISEPTTTDPDVSIETLARRVTELEQRIDEAAQTTSPLDLDDPELVAKVIQTCVASDALTEEEERILIRALL